jgi:hypothetical protein
VAENQEVDVSVTATATDRNGNASVPSDPVISRIDRLPPGQIR